MLRTTIELTASAVYFLAVLAVIAALSVVLQ